MYLEGKVWKDTKSKYWVVEVPALFVSTQGTSRKNALEMIKEAIELLVNKKDFSVSIVKDKESDFLLTSSDTKNLIALLLRQKRAHSGMSVRQVVIRLGAESPNAYARYETGKLCPTVEKLDELLKAIEGNEMILSA